MGERGRGRLPSESLSSFLEERIRQGSNLDLQAQAIHRKAPWDKGTKDCAKRPDYRSFSIQLLSFSTSSCSLSWVPGESSSSVFCRF